MMVGGTDVSASSGTVNGETTAKHVDGGHRWSWIDLIRRRRAFFRAVAFDEVHCSGTSFWTRFPFGLSLDFDPRQI